MAHTALYWWIKQTSFRTALLGLFFAFLFGSGLWRGGSTAIQAPEITGNTQNDLAASIQLSPLLSPSNATCANYWESFSTNLGVPAFITLNVAANHSTNSAEWRPNLSASGNYLVEAFIAAPPTLVACKVLQGPTQNTTQAIYTVIHAKGSTKVTINQSNSPNSWVSLGVFEFNSGSNGYIFLSDANSEQELSRFVTFGALRFTPSDGRYTSFLPVIRKSNPVVPSPEGMVVIRQKQAFDSCNRPTLSQMQTWWTYSPYEIYNLYIGGISNSSCYPELLTSSYIASARSQGWEFIPTWVGPQAPCTSFKYRFSGDPANAFGEGIQEANQAFSRAAGLGLVDSKTPNTVIYYDMEAFYGADDACKLAVRNFLSGWSQRLHELGARSGVYGSACYYMPDWTALSNPLDDAWIASWYKIDGQYQYDPGANVWNVICLSPSVWTNHQRIRQYAGGHNETWGGVTVNIDSNVTDGRVVSPPSAAPDKVFDVQAAIPNLIHQTIEEFQLIAPETGWLVDDGKLLWTEDGGHQWVDRTPSHLDGELISVDFPSDQEGWIAVQNSESQSLNIQHTLNGGENWQVAALPLGREQAGSVEKVFLDPLDEKNAWVSIRLASSSAFSVGTLFRTQDGGQSWQTLSLPVGESVRFVDSQTGWAAGGAAGNELYVTHDGGVSWQNADFIQDGSGTKFYSLPEFTDPLNGILAVTIKETGKSRVEIYATQDGGKNWQLSGLLPLNPQDEPATQVPLSVADPSTIIAADETSKKILAFGNQGILSGQAEASNLPEGVVEIQFITSKEGWAKTVQATCSGKKSEQSTTPLSCTVNQALWQTVDGGKTWTKIR